MKKAAMISFTEQGNRISFRLQRYFSGLESWECRGYVLPKWSRWANSKSGLEKLDISPGEWAGRMFDSCDLIIFIGAAGIAVRCIAPYVKDKYEDPAVLVIDTAAQYVIPILSGHIGGANEYAVQIAGLLGAVPVITTATDVHGLFSVDTFAAKNKLFITDRMKTKRVISQMLEGHTLRISCPRTQLPYGALSAAGVIKNHLLWVEDSADADIIISCQMPPEDHPALLLVPESCLWIGIGCKKGMSGDAIKSALTEFVTTFGLHDRAITGLASIDIKKEEEGILEACEYYQLKFHTYSAAQLMSMEGDFSSSQFVHMHTGTDNVCERAALMAAAEDARQAEGEAFALSVIQKQTYTGITLAAAFVNRRLRL